MPTSRTISKHIVLVAGEESSDQYAAHLTQQLLQHYPRVKISGIGGEHMQAAGVSLIYALAQFGLTGLWDVLRHARIIYAAFQALKRYLAAHPPDLFVLIDYPGFNLRVARYVKQHFPQTTVIYYISPQIWAWKAKRIHTSRRYVDHMAVIFPFEQALYAKAGVPASFVGHPLVTRVANETRQHITRAQLGLPEHQRIIALLPGSRNSEIKYHMPVLRETAIRLSQQFTDLHFVIPIATSLKPDTVKAYWHNSDPACTFILGQALSTLSCSDFVIVSSGTASLECALLGKPMCIIYKGSLLNYLIVTQVILVQYFGLCNVLNHRMIVPELLQYDCTPTELTRVMQQLLTNPAWCEKMTTHLKQLKQQLSAQQATIDLFQLVSQHLLASSAPDHATLI